MDLSAAAWISAAGLATFGGVLSWRSKLRPWLDLTDLRSWRQVLVLATLTGFFTLMGRGLSLFDDYLHLPLISRLAMGDFPPHFYLNPDTYFAYHYGLQVWAATLVRMADFFPWSAWDVAKAFTIAQTFLLAYLLILRQTENRLAGWLASVVLLIGGGARWLLLLLPAAWVGVLSRQVTLINTGANTGTSLVQALSSAWVIEGGGHFAFPFAFHNGVFVPVISVLGSTGALPFLTVLLLAVLLKKRELSIAEAAMTALILANLSLSAEHLFAFLWAAVFVLCAGRGIPAWRCKDQAALRTVWTWLAVLLVSAVVSLVQGGFITEAARGVVNQWFGLSVGQTSNFYGFSLRWPPAIYSAHLGVLSLLNPAQLLVLIFELGPGLLLAPAATRTAWRAYQRGDWFVAALGLAALMNFGFPMFLQYGVDRSITRLPGTALWLWLLLALPTVWDWLRGPLKIKRALAGALFGSLLLGGAVTGAVQVANIPYPQIAYFIRGTDAKISSEYWGKLDNRYMIIDTIPYRGVTLFGLTTRSNESIYTPLPDWRDFASNTDLAAAVRSGFGYVYIDQDRWGEMLDEEREQYSAPCVHLVTQTSRSAQDSAWLYDIRECATP